MLAFLRDLRPSGLARSAHIKADLESLTGLSDTDISVLLATYPGDKVAEYCAHIRSVVSKKPHTLVAYAWCFYMAVFSGGRWIRSELLKAPRDFWVAARTDAEQGDGASQRLLSEAGLSLWHFDGEYDGEDIKSDFKLRLAEAEAFFTPEERVDVIEEAKQIFVRSALLVQELDEKLGTDLDALKRLGTRPPHAREKGAEREEVVPASKPVSVSQAAATWLRRPEVTGAVVALGCLACVALLKLDFV